jgi:hypothetical protein
MIKQVKTIQDLHNYFKGKEIMIIGEHERRGSITRYMQMVDESGAPVKMAEPICKGLRMRVKTPFGAFIDLHPKNIYVITDKKTPNPIWN